MPDREVRTYSNLVHYRYVKQLARSAFMGVDAAKAKEGRDQFLEKTYCDLRDGRRSWGDLTREDWQLGDLGMNCAFCGAKSNLSREHLVSRVLRAQEKCRSCDNLQSIHNQVVACSSCSSSRGTRGVYHYLQSRSPKDPRFADKVPPLVERKYLKTIHQCLGCIGVLDRDLPEGATVLDLDDTIEVHLSR